MDLPNRPPSHRSDEYHINSQSSDWLGGSSPADSSSRSTFSLSPLTISQAPRHCTDDRIESSREPRKNTIQAHGNDSVTVPTSQVGQQRVTKQPQHSDRGANLALRYHRGSGIEQRPRSRTVYDSGKAPAGQSVTTRDSAPISRMRHSRHGSNTTAAVTSPLIQPTPLSSSLISSRIGSSRPRRRDIPDTSMFSTILHDIQTD